ncbi:MAG: PIN domain-containing protein [Thermodesulfobacteriota bacterium]|nr:PIN domain-containing protein [Thermodesulfobacteriota bacterium]
MILLDSDVMIDLFREYPPAKTWFDSINDSETMALPGFVVMELIQGCENKLQLRKLQRDLAFYETVWLETEDCEQALDVFTNYYLSHNAGLVDVMVGMTAVSLGVPLFTFNDKHYQFIPGLKTLQPYLKTS